MKQSLVLMLFLAALVIPSGAKGKGKLKVVSYNMLFNYDWVAKSPNQLWENRLPNAANFFKREKPDVVGSQELLTPQVEDLVRATGYQCTRGGKVMEGSKGENCAIFYNPKTIQLLDEGIFWFSETPDKNSYSWGMKYSRRCVWGKFLQKKTGKVFYMFNSHFYVDADMEEARVNAAKIIVERVHKVIKDYPVFCTGDLNNQAETPCIQTLLREAPFYDSYALAPKKKGPQGSFHNFDRHASKERIDHILVSEGIKIKNYRIDDSQLKTQKYESDHLPVIVETFLP